MARLYISLDGQDNRSNVISEYVYEGVFKRDWIVTVHSEKKPCPVHELGRGSSVQSLLIASRTGFLCPLRHLSASAPRPWGSWLSAFGSYAAQVTSSIPASPQHFTQGLRPFILHGIHRLLCFSDLGTQPQWAASYFCSHTGRWHFVASAISRAGSHNKTFLKNQLYGGIHPIISH